MHILVEMLCRRSAPWTLTLPTLVFAAGTDGGFQATQVSNSPDRREGLIGVRADRACSAASALRELPRTRCTLAGQSQTHTLSAGTARHRRQGCGTAAMRHVPLHAEQSACACPARTRCERPDRVAHASPKTKMSSMDSRAPPCAR